MEVEAVMASDNKAKAIFRRDMDGDKERAARPDHAQINSCRWVASGRKGYSSAMRTGSPVARERLPAAPTSSEAAPCSWPALRPSLSGGGFLENICSWMSGSAPP